jgi:hypothetical protein
MAHHHEHDNDTYYLDQLCMVGVTGAFAGICLTMYFLNTTMLGLLLKPEFHPLILASGIALLAIVLVRGVLLWQAVGNKPEAPSRPLHNHDHHDHGHGGHDHHHDHGHCDHDHHHEHVEAHEHHHHEHHVHAGTATPAAATLSLPVLASAHDHDHDHSWAPWRYVVLLVPLMLFMLGLPSKALPVVEGGTVDVTREASIASALIAVGPAPFNQAVMAAVLTADMSAVERVAEIYIDGKRATLAELKPGMNVAGVLVIDKQVMGNKGVAKINASDSILPRAPDYTNLGIIKAVDVREKTLTVATTENGKEVLQTFDLEAPIYIGFKELEALAFNPDSRTNWSGKKVQVIGQFAPYGRSDRWFSLARYRIQCCAADAVQLNVPIFCKEVLKDFKRDDWVRVTGRVEFREQPGRPGTYNTVLVVNRWANIVRTAADTDPYVR